MSGAAPRLAAPAAAAARDGARRAGRRLDRRRRGPRRAARRRGRRRRPRRRAATSARRRARDRRARPAGTAFQLSERVRDLAGARPPTAAGRSTSPRCAARRSRPTCARATSPSTRSRVPLAGGGEPIDPHGGARRPRGAASCAPVSERALRRRPAAAPARGPARGRARARARPGDGRARPRARRRARPSRPASASSPSCACCSPGPEPLRGLALLDELERDRGGPARARGAARRRAEPQPPPRRPRPHARGAGAAARGRGRPRALRRRRGAPRCGRCSPSRSPTSSPAATALRFGALLHDLGKPATRGRARGRATSPSSATTAIGARDRRRALRAAADEPRGFATTSQALTLHHLRLGFLVHERPLSRRAVYDYLRRTEPVAADVTLLTVADRLAARGGGPTASPEMIEAHLELAREMLAAALAWHRDGPPRAADPRRRAGAPSSGSSRGRSSGGCSRELEAAAFTGEVAARDEAIAVARALGRDRRTRARSTSSSGAAMAPCRLPLLRDRRRRRRRPRSSTPTSTRSPSWTSTRRPRATRWWCRATTPPTCSRSRDEDLERTIARRAAPRRADATTRSSPDGFNLLNACGAAAWQTVFHFHMHVVPRYEDDPLKLPWMPARGRRGRDRRDRRAGSGRTMTDERSRRSGSSATATSPRWCSPTRRSTCSATTPSTALDGLPRRGRGLRRPGAGLARRGRHLHRRRRRQRLPADRRRRRGGRATGFGR